MRRPRSRNARVAFAAHPALAVGGMERAVGVPEKRAAAGAAVNFWSGRKFVSRGSADSASAGNDVTKSVAVASARGKLRFQQAGGIPARCFAARRRSKLGERIRQTR